MEPKWCSKRQQQPRNPVLDNTIEQDKKDYLKERQGKAVKRQTNRDVVQNR